MIRCFYHDIFPIPVPDGHRFPQDKYSLLRKRLEQDAVVDLAVPPAVTAEQLCLAHSPDYIERVFTGQLTPHEIRTVGFPASPEQVERSRRSVGSTIQASYAAVKNGIGINLGGGTHHAHWDWGQGFSVFNDVIVSARLLQQQGKIERALVIDLDVHQGNGTASITAEDDTIYTFSMHGEKNFPFRKSASNLDIGLPNDTADAPYLDLLDASLWRLFQEADADMVYYVAGADPFVGDSLGKLGLSKAGLQQRDKMVLTACQEREIPVTIVLGGGYAKQIIDTVDIYYNTVQTALAIYHKNVS